MAPATSPSTNRDEGADLRLLLTVEGTKRFSVLGITSSSSRGGGGGGGGTAKPHAATPVPPASAAAAPAPPPQPPSTSAPSSERSERCDTHERLVAWFREHGVAFQQSTHAPTRTSEESAAVRGATLASGAKAMLMLASGGSGAEPAAAVLCVLSAARRLDWKKLRQRVQKGLRLATEEEVWAWTGCVPGAVPPFGSVFAPRPARTVMDVSIQEQGASINFNAGLRTESVHMSVADYVRVEQPEVIDIAM